MQFNFDRPFLVACLLSTLLPSLSALSMEVDAEPVAENPEGVFVQNLLEKEVPLTQEEERLLQDWLNQQDALLHEKDEKEKERGKDEDGNPQAKAAAARPTNAEYALAVEKSLARYFSLLDSTDKQFADELFGNVYAWQLSENASFLWADQFRYLTVFRLLAAMGHHLRSRVDGVTARYLFPFRFNNDIAERELRYVVTYHPETFEAMLWANRKKLGSFYDRYCAFLNQAATSPEHFTKSAIQILKDAHFKKDMHGLRKMFGMAFKGIQLWHDGPGYGPEKGEAPRGVNSDQLALGPEQRDALEKILAPLSTYKDLHTVRALIPQAPRMPVAPARAGQIQIPAPKNGVPPMAQEPAHNNKRKREDENPQAPISSMRYKNSVLHKRARGEKFFGVARNARVAGPTERREIIEILDTLEEYRPQLDKENFANARRTIELIRTAICENAQICATLWSQFSRGDSDYLTYPNDRGVVLHPEQDDMPVERRAFFYFETLKGAFKIAREHQYLKEFFTHAFFPPGDNTVCLESAQQALASFTEAKMVEVERRTSNVERTNASEEQIYRILSNVIASLKSRAPLKQLAGKTYDEFLRQERKSDGEEEGEADEKMRRLLLERADTAFAALRAQVIEATAEMLNSAKLIATLEEIVKCVNALCIFDVDTVEEVETHDAIRKN